MIYFEFLLLIQVSIGNTPEGTHAVGARLIAAERITIDKAQKATASSTSLRRRPISGGGERIPLSSTNITRII